MDEAQKQQFIKLTHFLGEVLGAQYEIVFHVVAKDGVYLAAIANSHISGRDLNSPLTAFASELIQNKKYLEEDFLCDYKALVGKSKLIRGSTFFIKNHDKLVGILCINHDTSIMRDLICKMIDLEKIDDMSEILGNITYSHNDSHSIETLSHSIEDILIQSVDPSYLNSDYQLSIAQKEEIAEKLYEKGIFNIKGAVPIVAKFLKISEPSVYRYLKKFKK
ncbi:PAS domain-containing protein [Campylobacter hepaticus]|uniref:DNA-binding protein n=1 Tax=Campylobacter hepaticus TaxID=1813019 RepID=A0A6A7JSX1_9BACT|nr:PAS domain-containing protein [Campylobacter hepaticus]AXP09003.1 DNA-binding protein [Campylobacter hepaticus]MCZ0771956.1 PAS domain-containing protein [Campylobacter hepaticus]MCZ0773425.1 PAS domain-containing protein [Campylobacter hepaticus]MCZ0774675.1 PAS domain-containing protein [Campylobacter hepaticus]MDX2323708.1 PAS domain-containing protein [Campylobacter hepaticus]